MESWLIREDRFWILTLHKVRDLGGVPFRAFSQRWLLQCLLPFPSAILCCKSASMTLPPATTCSYYSLYQVWQTWAYSLVFVQLVCWHTNVSRWSGGQPWRLLPFHRNGEGGEEGGGRRKVREELGGGKGGVDGEDKEGEGSGEKIL